MEENNRKTKILISALLMGILIILLSASVFYFNSSDKESENQISSQDNLDEISETPTEKPEEIEEIIEEIEEDPVEPETEVVPTPQPTPDPKPTPPPTKNWWDYPESINVIPLANVSHLSVVNKGNQLPSNYSPNDLVAIPQTPGLRILGTQYVRNMVITPLQQLVAAASAAGIDLSIKSSYRSFQTQQSTYQYWVSYNGGSTAAADKVSARPGHSEHQLGTVVDFSTSEAGDKFGSAFNNSAAASWLLQNAPQYGFRLSYPAGEESNTGYAHEGWHWRYWGE